VITDETIRLARRHLGLMDSVFYAPHVPADKEAAMCAVHGLEPSDEEPVLVLYDDTLFGGAKDGFLITPARLCWKVFTSPPHQRLWRDLTASSVGVEKGRLLVEEQQMPLTCWEPGQLQRLETLLIDLVSLASGQHVFRTASPLSALPGEIPRRLTAERVLELCREHLEGAEWTFFHPEIPPRKLRNTRALHAAHLADDEQILALHDNTLFGGAKDGFIITGTQICWKNTLTAPRRAQWRHVLEHDVALRSKMAVEIAGAEIWVFSAGDMAKKTMALLQAIAREAHW